SSGPLTTSKGAESPWTNGSRTLARSTASGRAVVTAHDHVRAPGGPLCVQSASTLAPTRLTPSGDTSSTGLPWASVTCTVADTTLPATSDEGVTTTPTDAAAAGTTVYGAEAPYRSPF